MIPGEPTAAQRGRAILERDGRDEGAVLIKAADLKILVMQAEALQHMAPHAAHAIEVGP